MGDVKKLECPECGWIAFSALPIHCDGCKIKMTPFKGNPTAGVKVACCDGLSDRAALYLEELHVSGDTMIEMDHSLEGLDDDKVGPLYLHDILAGFVESETGR